MLCVSVAACNRYVAIEPTELPRVAPPWPAGVPTPNARHVINLEGEIVKINGEFDVIVRTRSDDYEFSRPVAAWFAPGALVVAGGNQQPLAFALSEVRQVDIVQFSYGRTFAILVPITTVVLGVVLLSIGVGH
jgi:hypothetical protein